MGGFQQERTCAANCLCVCQWGVGARCQAVWSEDGRVYPATVVSLDGERCRVRFNGYGNEEDVELSALTSPDTAPQTQGQNSQVTSTFAHRRHTKNT